MAILLLTEITPKSVAVHNAQEVARIVVSLNQLALVYFNKPMCLHDLCCLTVHLG